MNYRPLHVGKEKRDKIKIYAAKNNTTIKELVEGFIDSLDEKEATNEKQSIPARS